MRSRPVGRAAVVGLALVAVLIGRRWVGAVFSTHRRATRAVRSASDWRMVAVPGVDVVKPSLRSAAVTIAAWPWAPLPLSTRSRMLEGFVGG